MGCHFLLQGIFPTQESNLGLLHCRQALYPLSHQGSLYWVHNNTQSERGKLVSQFLTAPYGMWDLSSLTRDRTRSPLHWQHRVLTARLPGKFTSSLNERKNKGLWEFWAGKVGSKAGSWTKPSMSGLKGTFMIIRRLVWIKCCPFLFPSFCPLTASTLNQDSNLKKNEKVSSCIGYITMCFYPHLFCPLGWQFTSDKSHSERSGTPLRSSGNGWPLQS